MILKSKAVPILRFAARRQSVPEPAWLSIEVTNLNSCWDTDHDSDAKSRLVEYTKDRYRVGKNSVN